MSTIDQKPLQDQVAIISGGLGDIGYAIALELANRGAHISIGDLQDEDNDYATSMMMQLRNRNVNSLYTKVDVTKQQEMSHWIRRTNENLGIPNLIIANAGIVSINSVMNLQWEQFQLEIDVNVKGSFFLAQMCARELLQKQLSGKIVFIGSWAGHRSHPSTPAYCASKAALRSLGQVMAKELAPHRILVNEVAPGAVYAGMLKKILDQNPGMKENAIHKIPVHAYIPADEIAWQVGNLCDPRNQHMCGSVTLIDGGLTLTDTWTDS